MRLLFAILAAIRSQNHQNVQIWGNNKNESKRGYGYC